MHNKITINNLLEQKSKLEEEYEILALYTGSKQIEIIDNRDFYIHNLEKQVQLSYDKAMKLAQTISEIRKNKALEFENHVMKQLKDLYLDNAVFKIEFDSADLSQKGIDKICFMISVNKGQNLSLLNETASGGEISRVMLAIKTILCEYDNVATMIFDEIDTGISGKAAKSVAGKLRSISKNHQVLCISHLAAIAASANSNYYISKKVENERTATSVKLLNEQEVLQEIARISSGEINEVTLQYANELRKNIA